jgi:hypothetical protein
MLKAEREEKNWLHVHLMKLWGKMASRPFVTRAKRRIKLCHHHGIEMKPRSVY